MSIFLQALFLFLSAFMSGTIALLFPHKVAARQKPLLIFGGSFLFSLTLIDLLPTFYQQTAERSYLLYFLLIGFFFQLFLDLFSHGIAHGHHPEGTTRTILPIRLISALFIHAIFDGLLVSSTKSLHLHHHHQHSLLSGIILHKMPTAFALVTILAQQSYQKRTIFFYLFIFSLASPVGCLLSYLFASGNLVFNNTVLLSLWALAIGNLLHIASTILSEANSQDHFNAKTVLAYLLGALLAAISTLH